MKALLSLRGFMAPYVRKSILALVMLVFVVFSDLAIPRLVERIIDQGIADNDLPVIMTTTLIMLGITALSTLMAIGNNILSVQVSEGAGRDVRDALFLKIQSFSFGNLDHLLTGQLIVRLTSDIAMLQRIMRISIRIGTRAPLLMIGSLILMLSTSPRLASAMLPLLLVMGGIIVWFISKTQPLYLDVQGGLDTLNNTLQENLAGIRVVKAFTRTKHEIRRFSGANQGLADKTIQVMQYLALLMPSLTFLINAGIALVIWVGGLQTIRGGLTLGEIVAFTNYLLTTMTPLVIMSNLAQVLAAANASAERIRQTLDEPVLVLDRQGAQDLPRETPGKVTFEDVCFSYDGDGGELALDGISFSAQPGETVALLGATGSGKTTLVNLVPRFYDVTHGRVTVDGRDVRDLRQESLLAHIGIVLQESVLFSGTVAENIRYGFPEASDDEMVEAAKAAQAHDFIMQLPDAYDTRVEERGVNLSGGQKQRIAIARAILPRPAILILDDSTSSVDVETESRIQESLDRIRRRGTRFVVAQRISTVLNADRIIVLEKGGIVAEGTHEQLMRSSVVYREIYDSQLGERPMLNGHEGDGAHV